MKTSISPKASDRFSFLGGLGTVILVKGDSVHAEVRIQRDPEPGTEGCSYTETANVLIPATEFKFEGALNSTINVFSVKRSF